MLGNVSEDFSANKLKTSWLNGYVDDFSVNCDSTELLIFWIFKNI